MNTEFLKAKGPAAISRVLGVSRQTIINYINGKGCMSVDQAIALSQHYGVSLSAIVDPDCQNQDNIVAFLSNENNRLLAKLNAIEDMLQDTYKNVENLIRED